MFTIDVAAAHAKLKAHRTKINAPWFDKPWDLNLFIARSGAVGRWDDLVLVACVDDANRPVLLRCVATGDAWQGEWTTPTAAQGCIYVLDQHVTQGYVLGTHHGRPALQQRANFRYVRWLPNGKVPTVAELETRAQGNAFADNRGTHLHNRVSSMTPAAPATDDSEGCTVNLYQHEHAALIRLVETQADRRGSAIVSPTFCKLTDLV